MTTNIPDLAPGRLRPARDRRRAAAVVLGSLLIVGIPLTRLSEGNSTKFGWQMFSNGRAAIEFTVINDDGDSYEADPADYVVIFRSELPIFETLPQHLCSVEPGAVTVIARAGETEDRVSC